MSLFHLKDSSAMGNRDRHVAVATTGAAGHGFVVFAASLLNVSSTFPLAIAGEAAASAHLPLLGCPRRQDWRELEMHFELETRKETSLGPQHELLSSSVIFAGAVADVFASSHAQV